MKLCTTVIIRTIFLVILLAVSSLVMAKLCLMAKEMAYIEELQINEMRNKTILEIKEIGRLFGPLNSSASNLARSLNSSIGGRKLSFADIQREVAPKLLLALTMIPHAAQVSYMGSENLLFSYYENENQILAIFSNTSFASKWFIQPVNRYTGKLYGQALNTPPLVPTNSTSLQVLINRTSAHSAFIVWEMNKPDETSLFSCIVPLDGGGVINLGFSSIDVLNHFKGVNFNGGDFFFATIDGNVLVNSKIQGVKILVKHGIVEVNLVKDNGEFEDRVGSYSFEGKNVDDFGQFYVNIRGVDHIFYCSTVEIAGVQTVYTLAYRSNGIEAQVHKNSKLELILLGVMHLIIIVSLCIFIALIVRAAKREIYLCTALIKQMESTHQAERKSMNKSLAFASASHDVRNSMTTITGLIELCHESILNSVMDTSKIEAGKMQLEEEEFNLAQLLEGVVDMYYPIGVTKGIDVILDPCDWSVLKLHRVKGDRGKLKQILCNLLSNAIKFTSEGHITLRAFVQKTSKESAIIASNQKGLARFLLRMCCKNNKSLTEYDELCTIQKSPNCMEFVFEVDDTGKGIPKEKQKSVFEYFVQVKETALEQGCGLGLGIVQSLIRLMGGEIKIVDKEPGEKGTCFRFNIFLTTCDPISNTDVEEQEKNMQNDSPSSPNFHQYFQLITRSPASRTEGSHVILLIPSEERRKISKKSIENLGVKVSTLKGNEDLFHVLEKIKAFQCSSSGRIEVSLNDQLRKSLSESSNSNIFESSLSCDHNARKSSTKFSSRFTLLVIDASFGPFSDLYSVVENFMKETQNYPQCKVVWLDNMVTRYTSSVNSTHKWEHFLMKPFHGSHLYRVLGLLPEFGGIESTRLGFSYNQEKKHDLEELVIHKCSEELISDEKKPLKEKKVLVVEDGVALRKLAFTCLSKIGATVDVCENGKEAFDKVCKALKDQIEEGSSMSLPYDYIFMDCQMPVMDGYEATRMIRMHEKAYGIHIPIIALTADAMGEEFSSKSKNAGMDFHLTKPLQVEKLLAAIRTVECNRQFGLIEKGNKMIS
ncbi:hypothetical protein LguiA_008206 [Lonicera macranthoides]